MAILHGCIIFYSKCAKATNIEKMKLYNTYIKQLYICKPAGNSQVLNNMFVNKYSDSKNKLYEN